jgi:hypothetical protein
MAANEYITIAQLTYKPIVNVIAQINAQGGSLDEIQNYVDRANDYYEDLAQRNKVAVDDIQFPVPILVSELLNYYVTWKYASESKGQLNLDITGSDIYRMMEQDSFIYYRDTLKSINGAYISGTSDSTNRVSIGFGNMIRG